MQLPASEKAYDFSVKFAFHIRYALLVFYSLPLSLPLPASWTVFSFVFSKYSLIFYPLPFHQWHHVPLQWGVGGKTYLHKTSENALNPSGLWRVTQESSQDFSASPDAKKGKKHRPQKEREPDIYWPLIICHVIFGCFIHFISLNPHTLQGCVIAPVLQLTKSKLFTNDVQLVNGKTESWAQI